MRDDVRPDEAAGPQDEQLHRPARAGHRIERGAGAA